MPIKTSSPLIDLRQRRWTEAWASKPDHQSLDSHEVPSSVDVITLSESNEAFDRGGPRRPVRRHLLDRPDPKNLARWALDFACVDGSLTAEHKTGLTQEQRRSTQSSRERLAHGTANSRKPLRAVFGFSVENHLIAAGKQSIVGSNRPIPKFGVPGLRR